MFRRLVQNIRNGYPEYMTRPFEVAELYQHLVPYRHNRRELEIETNQDYEVALCRLLAGERDYLAGDDDMRDAIKREMASSNPNTAVFREFAASRVAISAHGIHHFGDIAASPPSAPSLLAPTTPSAAADPVPSGHAHPPRRSPQPVPSISGRRNSPPSGTGVIAPNPTANPTANPSANPRVYTTACTYCGHALPPGREASFCPYCGQNLKTQRCPACGTELDIGWQYCITCGRGVAAT
ncbi:MAG TPA: zinc ribbon domain-containing protein [Gemmatimonadaceae bacterium]|nr:zinc ribbon domain-containing protein [Gemmatimonadaceae bacterium]